LQVFAIFLQKLPSVSGMSGRENVLSLAHNNETLPYQCLQSGLQTLIIGLKLSQLTRPHQQLAQNLTAQLPP
jgi:hypothetical protein